MRSIRVCMLVHNYYLRDPRVRKEAESLAAEGFSIDVVSLSEPGSHATREGSRQKTVNGVRIHVVRLAKKRGGGSRYLFEYLAMLGIGAWKILRMHLKEPFDVVHIHNMPDFLVLAGLLPKLMGAKLVLDIHDPMPELYESMKRGKNDGWILRAITWQEKWCCRLADRVVSVNETVRETLERKGIDSGKIFILHNYPDLGIFPLRTGSPPRRGRENPMTLLFAGTVTDQNNLAVAVRAVAVAIPEVPNLVLRILGDGNKADEISKTARELGVADRIVFRPSVPADKVREEMGAADAGISPHRTGIFGDLCLSTKILEYMTQGLPVICSRTYTNERYVPGNAVFYFEPDDPVDMARQIIAVCRDTQAVVERTGAATKLVTRLSWAGERKRLVTFYRALVGAGPGARTARAATPSMPNGERTS